MSELNQKPYKAGLKEVELNQDELLQSRWILNVSAAPVRIWQDERFNAYCLKKFKPLIIETVLKTGEALYVLHGYYRHECKTQKIYALRECYDQSDLNASINALKALK